MKRWQKRLLGVLALAGMVTALAVEAVWAQRGGIAVRSKRGSTWYLPSLRQGETPLFSPFSSGTLERNFAIMRNTSPNPDLFMGGQLNPRPSSVKFGFGGFLGDFFYLDASFAYHRYGYGYYPPYGYSIIYPPLVPPLLYPWGYAAYPATTRERVVIIQREPPARAEPYGPRTPPRTEPSDRPAPRAEPSRGDAEYYLSPREGRAGEGLADALLEIRRAWLNGDFERFRARIRDGGKVRIYPGGAYRYSVSAADFAQMTRDAMSRLDTLSFELDAPRSLGEDRVFVSGKHVYRDADGEKREVHISYVLAREEGRWYIVEAGSGSAPISRHSEESSR